MAEILVKQPYTYYPGEQLICKDKSRVEKQHQQRCDINTIMARCRRTGVLPTRTDAAQYGDFTQVTDFHSAVNQVKTSMDAFMSLPAELRKRFDNDPAKLLKFIEDEQNYDEAVELGIFKKTAPEPTPEPEPETPPEG